MEENKEEIRETDFDKLYKKVTKVYEGNSDASFPMGFPRLEKHISLRRGMYYLVAGYTGSGKSSFVEDAFILNPYEYYEKFRSVSNLKLKILYYSMERSKEFKLIKWTIRKIFKDTGYLVELGSCLGWRGFPKLTKYEHELIGHYKQYIDGMLETGVVEIFEDPTNPMAIKKTVDEYAKTIGRFEKINEHKSVYIPNDTNLLTLVIKDHCGLYKPETRDGIKYGSKKEIIDLASSDDRRFRDRYGGSFSIVEVSQLNRSIANPMRLKNSDVEIQLEDIKESGNTAEDADCVIGLFDPMRYKVADPAGYDLNALRDSYGNKYYRYIKILKNTYGADGIGIGLAMQPQVGCFAEMVKKDIITPGDYQNIQNGKFFYENKI